MRPLRVLVVDDSTFNRRALTSLIEENDQVEVVGTASDGDEALRLVASLNPDLITLDLEMPRMDGFTFLRLVMSKRPTPVIVISGRAGEEDVFKALELGAVDFIAKPKPHAAPELVDIEQELIRKVHAMRELRIDKVRDRLRAAPMPVSRAADDTGRCGSPVVVIGSSTGGPAALMQVFGSFTEAIPCAFVVAQHMPEVVHHTPEATYLGWLDCRALDLTPSPAVFFLKEAAVALSDGHNFGAQFKGFARINFATSRDILTQVLERMKGALAAR